MDLFEGVGDGAGGGQVVQPELDRAESEVHAGRDRSGGGCGGEELDAGLVDLAQPQQGLDPVELPDQPVCPGGESWAR